MDLLFSEQNHAVLPFILIFTNLLVQILMLLSVINIAQKLKSYLLKLFRLEAVVSLSEP